MDFLIHAYRNNRDEIICIPYALDKDGILRNVNKPQITSITNGEKDIGIKITDALQECGKRHYNDNELTLPVHEIVIGKKWGSFFKESKCVVVELTSSHYLISSTKKIKKIRVLKILIWCINCF
ncbi:hypothetical protein PCURB6_10690 [Paenibacillus curdlanolyticus]|nr:hypothetical protein PCURB6_10690 [Paenibacillus curdlanolyticus]